MKKAIAILLILLLFLCTGCASKSGEDLSQTMVNGIKNAVVSKLSATTSNPTAAPAPSQQPEAQEAEPEGSKERESSDLFLCLEGFSAEPMEYGTEFHEDGTFVDSYFYDGMVTVRFGRLERADTAEQAVSLIAPYAYTEPEKIEITAQGSLDGYPAYALSYVIGSNEDTQLCRDLLVTAEDAVHWFHCSVYADWFEDYESLIEDWTLQLVLEPLDGPQSAGRYAG